MLKNERAQINKKKNPVYSGIKKLRIFLRIRITFNFKIIHRIFRAGVIIQCSLHQAKGGGWF